MLCAEKVTITEGTSPPPKKEKQKDKKGDKVATLGEAPKGTKNKK